MKILVVLYYFPPYNKVGARRWAKHAKYFYKHNTDFEIICAAFNETISPWHKEEKLLKPFTLKLPQKKRNVPLHLKRLPTNIIDKLFWKLSYWKYKYTTMKKVGNYNDPTIVLYNDYLEKCRLKLKGNQFTHLLISGGPFYYSKLIPELKKEFPEIKYCLDYRDYWEDSVIGLTKLQESYELQLQQNVLNNTDLVLSPNLEMQLYYKEKFKKKSYCLPHCYDTDDIKIKSSRKSSNEIKLIYGGAFYNNIDENLVLIKEFINQVSTHKIISADFYVSIKGYEESLKHHLIKRFDFIVSSEYFNKVQQADYVILILPPNRVNAMSSKFFELVALRKPIVYFGGAGDVSEYLIKHRLGYHVTIENLTTVVNDILSNINTQNIPDENYDVSLHTFEHQTKLLVDILTQL